MSVFPLTFTKFLIQQQLADQHRINLKWWVNWRFLDVGLWKIIKGIFVVDCQFINKTTDWEVINMKQFVCSVCVSVLHVSSVCCISVINLKPSLNMTYIHELFFKVKFSSDADAPPWSVIILIKIRTSHWVRAEVHIYCCVIIKVK